MLDQSKSLVLARDGVPCAAVVTGADPVPAVRFAASELAAFLGQAVDADIPVVREAPADGVALLLGDQPAVRALGVDVSTLPRDAFVIRSGGNVIAIAGRDDPAMDPMRDLRGIHEHATLFAVYDFLERFVGVRFYFPGPIGTVVPDTPTLTVPGIDLYEEPDCDQRRIYAGPGARWYEDLPPKEISRAKLLAGLRFRRQTFYIPCCHGLARRCYAERFADTHPEWFALLPNGKRDTDMSLPGHHGHLCYLNEGLRDQIYRDSEAFLLGKPAEAVGMITRSGRPGYDWNAFQEGYVDLCPQDGLGESQWCQMPECKRYWDEGKQGELIWGLVADIAGRLKRNNIPGFATCFAYGAYRDVPSVELPDNVLVQLCIAGPWDDRIPSRRERNDALIKAWNQKCKAAKIWLWNYMNNYNGQVPEGVPPISPALIEQYYSRVGPQIRGAFNESEIGYWLFNYINYYTFFRMMWNTETDVGQMLREHYDVMFGPAAETMGTFFATLEQIWTNRFLGEVLETPLGPVRTRRSDREVWDEIFTEQVMDNLRALLQKAENQARNAPQAAKRVAFFNKHFYGEMTRVRDQYRQKQRGVEDLVADVPRTPDVQTPTIDGRLEADEWKDSARIWLVPLKSEERLVETVVHLAWQPDALLLGFDCLEPQADRLYLAERKHDDPLLWKDAGIEIFLNPSGDRRRYVQLVINANGVLSDTAYTIIKGSERESDAAWTSQAQVATWIGPDRWQAEVRIPLAPMSAEPLAPGAEWVANVCRSRNITEAAPGENQLYTWSPFLKKQFHDLQNMGRFRFVATAADAASRIPDAGSFDVPLKGRKIGEWWLPQDKEQQACFAQDAAITRDGPTSLRISCTDDSKQQAIHATQWVPPFENGKRYLLTFWVRAENVTPVPGLTGYRVNHAGGFANINFASPKQDGNNNFFPRGGFRGTFPWTKVGFEIPAPPALDPEGRPYIRMSLANATGTVWYDDVRIRPLDD
jgi:hypothetical protein